MYIPQFVCGVVATLGVEIIAIVVGVVISEMKKGKEEKKHE